MFSRKAFYYFAIVEDLVLRFSWSISLVLSDRFSDYKEDIVSLFAILEVVRRFIWNFFRLENEHLNNCGQFRAVRDILILKSQKQNTVDLSAILEMHEIDP